MKSKTDEKSKADLKEVENMLGEKYARDNFEKIKEKAGNIDSDQGGISSGSLWSLKKELFPQSRYPPTAIIGPSSGNLPTSEDKIQGGSYKNLHKKISKQTHEKRLRTH